MTVRNAERNIEIVRRHEAGETFASIGPSLGITRRRAHYIYVAELGRRRRERECVPPMPELPVQAAPWQLPPPHFKPAVHAPSADADQRGADVGSVPAMN